MPVNRVYEELTKEPIIPAVFVSIAVVIAMPVILAGFAITRMAEWVTGVVNGK